MSKFTLREASVKDIPHMQIVRHSVRENVLSNPDLVTTQHYEEYLTHRGKGWVAEVDGIVQGFAIADLQDRNIWALFVHPDHEKQGLGRQLHDRMLRWYFEHGMDHVWLGTDPDTRADGFYRRSGWKPMGLRSNGEMRFEMTHEEWRQLDTQ